MLANFSDDTTKKGKPSDEISTPADKKEKADDKKDVTSKRLNELLALMTTNSDLKIIKEVIKPRSAAEKKERQKAISVASRSKEPKSENIAEAAKKVAETLGGDAKKTESELLAILLKSGAETGDHNLKYVYARRGVNHCQNSVQKFHKKIKSSTALYHFEVVSPLCNVFQVMP